MIKQNKKSTKNVQPLVMRTNGNRELEKSALYYRTRLEEWIQILEKALENQPPGRLRIGKSRGRAQYYQIKSPDEKNGTYLPRTQYKLARALAQKEYDKRLLAELSKQKKALERMMKGCDPGKAEKLYAQMSPQRRTLVEPRVMDDFTFAEIWSAMEFPQKDLGVNAEQLANRYVTEKGEIVRSKSELIIANELHRMGIPYRYECALHLSGMGVIHPDFTILKASERREIYWEHLGMMDDRGYCADALARIDCYEKNGYFPGKSLILTHETSRTPLGTTTVKAMIREYILEE